MLLVVQRMEVGRTANIICLIFTQGVKLIIRRQNLIQLNNVLFFVSGCWSSSEKYSKKHLTPARTVSCNILYAWSRCWEREMRLSNFV